jgi:hypothetical protein
MYAVREGRRVRCCVPCAGTLFPPRSGDADSDTDTDTDADVELSRLEQALDTIAKLRQKVALADALVAIYDAAIYDEGTARAEADELLGRYERSDSEPSRARSGPGPNAGA